MYSHASPHPPSFLPPWWVWNSSWPVVSLRSHYPMQSYVEALCLINQKMYLKLFRVFRDRWPQRDHTTMTRLSPSERGKIDQRDAPQGERSSAPTTALLQGWMLFEDSNCDSLSLLQRTWESLPMQSSFLWHRRTARHRVCASWLMLSDVTEKGAKVGHRSQVCGPSYKRCVNQRTSYASLVFLYRPGMWFQFTHILCFHYKNVFHFQGLRVDSVCG